MTAPWSTKRCASCGAAIIWALTTSGKRMPVDAIATTGAFTLHPRDAGLAPEARFSAEVKDGHTSHFATCPQAAQHRKPR
jgi:hypothetical protein